MVRAAEKPNIKTQQSGSTPQPFFVWLRHRTKYGYDRAGNRTWKENVVAGSLEPAVHLDEKYTYDDVYQLTKVERGQLTGLPSNPTVSNPDFTQDWTLDGLGNWATFDDDGTSQTRDHTAANEIEKIDGETTNVAHDTAGNMIRVPKLEGSGEHFHLKYDAWNRLVEVYDDDNSTLIAEYQYDGVGRRIIKGVDDGTDGSLDTFTHFLHTGNQVIETREGDDVSGAAPAADSLDPKYQNVWSPRYIDALILRDENKDGDDDCIDGLDQRLFFLSDANFNVTALVDTSGNVVERYVYDPYGRMTIYDDDWSHTRSSSSYENVTLFTGRELDLETILYYYRARYYHAGLGRFVSRDSLGYDGGYNLLQYASASPVSLLDPYGYKPVGKMKVRLRQLDHESVWDSRAYIDWKPPADWLEMPYGDCPCPRVQLFQIAYSKWIWRTLRVQHAPDILDWHFDPIHKLEDYEVWSYGGRVVRARAMDDPGFSDFWSVRSILYHGEQKFETCAVCVGGDRWGEVFGCVQWGHSMTREGDRIAKRLWAMIGSLGGSTPGGVAVPDTMATAQYSDQSSDFYEKRAESGWHPGGRPSDKFLKIMNTQCCALDNVAHW